MEIMEAQNTKFFIPLDVASRRNHLLNGVVEEQL